MADIIVAWQVEDVCAWLRTIKLDHLCPFFLQHNVDGRLLQKLNDETLKELGVESGLDRAKLMSRKEALFVVVNPDDLLPEAADDEKSQPANPVYSHARASQPSSSGRRVHRNLPSNSLSNLKESGPSSDNYLIMSPQSNGSIHIRDINSYDIGDNGDHNDSDDEDRDGEDAYNAERDNAQRSSSFNQRQVRTMTSMRKQKKYRQGFSSFRDNGDIAVLPSTHQTNDSDHSLADSQGNPLSSLPEDESSSASRVRIIDDFLYDLADGDEDESSSSPQRRIISDSVYDLADAHEDVYGSTGADANSVSFNTDDYMAMRKKLMDMFPGAGKADVEDALRLAKGSKDAAIDHLLAVGCSRDASTLKRAQQRLKADYPHRFASDQDAAWLHGNLSREEAEKLLDAFGAKNGLFLIRKSSTVEDAYVLSLCYDNQKLHHIIYSEPNQRYEIFDLVFGSLTDLVGFFSDYQKQDGWYTPLTQHVPNDMAAPRSGVVARSGYARLEDARRWSSIGGHGSATDLMAQRMSQISLSHQQQQQQQQQQRAGEEEREVSIGRLADPRNARPASTTRLTPAARDLIAQQRRRSGGGSAISIDRTASIHVPAYRPQPNSARAHRSDSFDNPFFNGQDSGQESDVPPPLPEHPSGTLPLNPRDFDLNIQESKPYGGDKVFKVTVVGEDGPIGLMRPEFPKTLVLCTMQHSVELRTAASSSIVHAEFAYGEIDVDFTDKRVRLNAACGPFTGTYYFECKKARALYSTVQANKDRLLRDEDQRLAKILQSEEFPSHMRSHPDFASMQTAPPSRKKKILSRIAKSFKVRRQKNAYPLYMKSSEPMIAGKSSTSPSSALASSSSSSSSRPTKDGPATLNGGNFHGDRTVEKQGGEEAARQPQLQGDKNSTHIASFDRGNGGHQGEANENVGENDHDDDDNDDGSGFDDGYQKVLPASSVSPDGSGVGGVHNEDVSMSAGGYTDCGFATARERGVDQDEGGRRANGNSARDGNNWRDNYSHLRFPRGESRATAPLPPLPHEAQQGHALSEQRMVEADAVSIALGNDDFAEGSDQQQRSLPDEAYVTDVHIYHEQGSMHRRQRGSGNASNDLREGRATSSLQQLRMESGYDHLQRPEQSLFRTREIDSLLVQHDDFGSEGDFEAEEEDEFSDTGDLDSSMAGVGQRHA